MNDIWLEIHHASFQDGTLEHPLLCIKLPNEAEEFAKIIFKNKFNCHSIDAYDYFEIFPHSDDEEERRAIANILELTNIVGSIWVVYYLKILKL